MGGLPVNRALLHGLYKPGRIDVEPQADHLETASLQHQPHQVLADVMQVAQNGAQRHLGHRLYAVSGQ